ncbi:MAG: LamG domain-containing protein [Devosia sp.]|nr:LamG domain-containing protein [Devosia sp.]
MMIPFGVYAADRDPYFANVSLLLHFDGTDGSTTFSDSSSNNLTVTPSGQAHIENTAARFGPTSAQFDGSGDYLTVSSNPLLNFGSGDYTVECWMYLTASVAAADKRIVSGTGNNGFEILIGSGNTSIGVQNIGQVVAGSFSPAINQWYALAYVRSGGTARIYVDGTLLASATDSSAYTQQNFQIGGISTNSVRSLPGYLDEFRVTKGVGRYFGSNYTVPNRPFTNR